jgi:serine/threonine protein kinase/peptidoglycan hydrolase-like protein with peptidoglycan-binding domain
VDFVALQAGQTIGRYTVVSVLGQGGFGITYRAHDSQLGREVAIKEYLPTAIAVRQGGETVLPRSTKVAEDFTWGRERFVSEGRTLASLHHAPGIVRVFDFLEINGTAYIVMELLHGETLEDRIKKQGALDAAAIDRILTPLLNGLEQVHKAGFLHRDIKPANILLNANGDPTLIDFGASRAAMAGRSVAMTAVFTPGYAATEQMTSAKQGPWTDIYALSATLYHAITGKAPPNAFDRMLDDECETLARLAPAGVAPGLIAGIDAGLAVRASDRPQSIEGWRVLLTMTSPGADEATRLAAPRPVDAGATMVARVPTQQPVQAPTVQPAPAADLAPAPPSAPPVAARKSKVPLYAGLAAAVLLLAGGGYFALAPKPAPQATSVRDLKIEELEKVLAERRAADSQAAEKRRAEEDAQRKADAEATAKRAADAELEQARVNRQKAEEELAKLKAQIETRRVAEAGQRQQSDAVALRAAEQAAQRKAEAEMAALRQTEEDARNKAAAEAEANRLAVEALAKAQTERQQADAAARQKAEAEARQKAEADTRQLAEAEARQKIEAEARQKAEVEAQQKAAVEAASLADKKAAEAAEAALRLSLVDRQRVQVALTSLGFDTRGADGAFGPRSRDMVAAWQKARSHSATGYLLGPQNQALLREAAPALSKYDDEQKKVEEDKKKAEEARRKVEEEAKARAAAPAAPPTAASPPAAAAPAPAAAPPNVASAAPAGGNRLIDGTYTGSMNIAFSSYDYLVQLSVKVVNGSGTGTVTNPRCGAVPFSFKVDAAGNVTGRMKFTVFTQCDSGTDGKLAGQAEGSKGIRLEMDGTTTNARGRGKIRLAE